MSPVVTGTSMPQTSPWDRLSGFRAPGFLDRHRVWLAYIAAHAHAGGPNLFRFYFIDRPPLLLGIFHLADATGGTPAVRAIGALAATMLVALVALIARELGGARSAIWAAFIAAILGSSPALLSVFTPAELLAVLPSAASVLLLLIAWRSFDRVRLGWFALAGFLAIVALLVKQSFGDALVAGLACLAAGFLFERPRRRSWMAASAAYAGGALTVLLALELWERLYQVPDGAVTYALLDFRIQGLAALSSSAGLLLDKFTDRLLLPLVVSGLVLVLLAAVVGVRRLSGRRGIQVTVGVWAATGLAGVLLGGGYLPHYLIELIPVAAAMAGLALASASRRVMRLAATGIVVVAVAMPTLAPSVGTATNPANEALAIGSYVRNRARPADSIYILYSQPNITYYSGLRTPYPYQWSLMIRTVPHAQARLRAL